MPLGGMHLPFLKLQLQHTVWDKRLNFEIPVPVPTKLRSDTEVSQMPSMVLDFAPKLHACHVIHRRYSYRHTVSGDLHSVLVPKYWNYGFVDDPAVAPCIPWAKQKHGHSASK